LSVPPAAPPSRPQVISAQDGSALWQLGGFRGWWSLAVQLIAGSHGAGGNAACY